VKAIMKDFEEAIIRAMVNSGLMACKGSEVANTWLQASCKA
jgi:hypothetical protein